MMVGLPGSGKSLWVKRHCAINPEKKYLVLSTENILHQMKVLILANQTEQIIDRATQCFN